MNCNEAMEKYLALDKGKRIPFSVTWHFLCCKKCRAEVRLLRRAEDAACKAAKAPVPLDDETILCVMKRLSFHSPNQKKYPLNIPNWIACGVAMLLLFFAFALLTKNAYSGVVKVYIYIELAALISAYYALFIKCNLDFFVKLINTKISHRAFS